MDHVVLTVREAGANTRVAAVPVTADEVVLAVEADEAGYTFRVGETSLGTIERSFFSTERAGGFVGVYIGLYATGNGRPSHNRAHVRWFSYEPR
jgi:alpha-N-arabinofuranosidase